MDKHLQAKHLDESRIFASIDRQVAERPDFCGAILWEISHDLDAPERVVRAKLASMIRRGLITGCTCGCRGDFLRTKSVSE